MHRCGALGIHGQTKLAPQYVGGSTRKNSQRHIGIQHAIRHFVQCAITPRRQNEVTAVLDQVPRLGCCAAGSGRGDHGRLNTLLGERRGGTLEQVLVTR